MVTKRIVQLIGMVLIGDGILSALAPKRHARLWRGGPKGWRRLMRNAEREPDRTRSFGVAEAALGLWLARRQLSS
jgi:uncharacterized protein YjeT (DUF2065 family)